MKKRRTQSRKRTVWTADGKKQTQVTLFRPQVEDRATPDPAGGPKKRKPRKKFLLGTGRV